MYVLLNAANLICCFGSSIMVPFFPVFASDREIGLDTVGWIFALFPFGMFIASLILGKMQNDNNRPWIMATSVFVQAIQLFIIGALYYIENTYIIIYVAAVCRFIEGFSNAMFTTPFYAFIQQLYPDEVEEKIAYSEIYTGIGYMGGPFFGSLLFWIGGYTLPFYTFGLLCVGVGVVLLKNYNGLKKTRQQEKIQQEPQLGIQEEQEESKLEEPEIGYLAVCKKYSILVHILSTIIASISYTFYQPIYSDYFKSQYNIDSDQSGYFYCALAIAYAMGSLAVSYVKKYKPFYIYFSMVLMGYLEFYSGPDKYFTNLDHNLWTMMIAQSISVFFSTYPYILAIPCLNEIIMVYYPNSPTGSTNISSAIYNACQAIGEFFGPLAGGYLGENYGFERACSVLGIFMIFGAVLYGPYLFIMKSC